MSRGEFRLTIKVEGFILLCLGSKGLEMDFAAGAES